ncbi:MAG: RDD family protein [Pseudonocardiaceae bacterium]
MPTSPPPPAETQFPAARPALSSTQWSVVTPEAVPLELVTAGLGSRFLALTIDWAIQASLAMAVLIGLSPILDGIGGGVGVAILLVLLTLIAIGYPVITETLWRGRTVGKAALGLRVVTAEGGPVCFRHAMIRASVGLVDFAITTGGAAVISVLATSDNRRLGDLAAGTLVLRERSGLRRPIAARFEIPASLVEYAATLDVTAVGTTQYGLIRTFLLRATSMRPAARHQLAVQLANSLTGRISPPPPPGIDAEAFLAAVAATHQGLHAVVGPTRDSARLSPWGDPPGDIEQAERPDNDESPEPGGFAPLVNP